MDSEGLSASWLARLGSCPASSTHVFNFLGKGMGANCPPPMGSSLLAVLKFQKGGVSGIQASLSASFALLLQYLVPFVSVPLRVPFSHVPPGLFLSAVFERASSPRLGQILCYDEIAGLLDPSPLSAVNWVFDFLVIFSLTCPLSCLFLTNISFILKAEFHTYPLRHRE